MKRTLVFAILNRVPRLPRSSYQYATMSPHTWIEMMNSFHGTSLPTKKAKSGTDIDFSFYFFNIFFLRTLSAPIACNIWSTTCNGTRACPSRLTIQSRWSRLFAGISAPLLPSKPLSGSKSPPFPVAKLYWDQWTCSQLDKKIRERAWTISLVFLPANGKII